MASFAREVVPILTINDKNLSDNWANLLGEKFETRLVETVGRILLQASLSMYVYRHQHHCKILS
ncbi:hypothetical protein BGW80DRAFT_1291845 [Lactifluus volemus]|nr:hypothetical protein BGW80DRAFT_1291845 [Lactifluus volemus]